jgi:hypothetical protein
LAQQLDQGVLEMKWNAIETFDDEGELGLVVMDAAKDVVCRMPGIGHHDVQTAKLIAAAPDLLAALIVLRERHQIDDPHHAHYCEFCKLADAAIRSAT